jgi:hypothetical protein
VQRTERCRLCREIDAIRFTIGEIGATGRKESVTKKVPKIEPGKKAGKRKYQPPAFRFEPVFEVAALSCGKVSATQGSCHSNLKFS